MRTNDYNGCHTMSYRLNLMTKKYITPNSKIPQLYAQHNITLPTTAQQNANDTHNNNKTI